MRANDLNARISAMQEPSSDPDLLYHAITLTADDDLKVIFGTQSHWVGWTEDRRHEIRESRLVYSKFAELWKSLGLPYCFVHSPDELTVFLVAGGNALVERALAEKIFPNQLRPHACVPHGPAGYKSPELFESTAFRRAPTPKLRMQIFDRDGRKCRICGRRPDDNTDLVLHVHHIRPWERGGLTDPLNLITLCHTCHSGLTPHEDIRLFDYIAPAGNDSIQRLQLDFSKCVAKYRKVGFLGTPGNTKKRQRKKPSP
jgi:HNH endonuclease